MILTNEYDLSINFLSQIPHELEITSKGIEYGIPFIRGKIRNLKIRITKSKIKIEGSIHVFYKGNNLDAMTFKEYIEAMELLKECLELPLEMARVSRLDFSGNMKVKHDPAAYFNYFGQKSRFRKSVLDNGVIYGSEEKGLIFYDKIREMKRKREVIPEYFKGKNIMRFEIRFTRKLGKTFHVPELQVMHLMDRSFFNKLCLMWRQEFKSLIMEMESPLELQPIGSKTKLIESLALQQIHKIGIDQFLDEISSWQLAGEITKKDAYEIRKFIKEKAAEKYPLAENELIRELNQKIKVAARFEV
ncbi:phage/plasmid replication domain-containing protein [Sunxiuqinia sp. sy24]|uniref:phage/plasmid replication domain-containing protein n=1 Tax=Sunxiuqinia sp. sy24 TaxID=3461495 RepID=UPI004045A493